MIKKIFYRLLYYLLVIAASIIRIIPFELGATIGGITLGIFAYDILRIRNKEVRHRLSESFPEKSPSEINRLARKTYIQFLTSMTELIYFPKLTVEDINNMVEIEGMDLIKKLSATRIGAIFVSGHYGNWELMGAALTKYLPVNFLVGRQENAPVDKMLNNFRRGKGIKIIPLEMSLKNVLRALKSGEIVCMLSDQDAREHGVFVNFMGKPASTPKGPSTFSIKTKLPLVTGFIIREKVGKYKIYFEEMPQPSEGTPEEEAVKILTQTYTSRLEDFVRKRPDHWFWLHRRWKTKIQDD